MLIESFLTPQMLEGEFEHEDFVGHKGRIGPGDLQFMIAGQGIMHAEMPCHTPGGQDPLGLQLSVLNQALELARKLIRSYC